jgi:hypothetical protein
MTYGLEIRRPNGTKLISTDDGKELLGQVSAGNAVGVFPNNGLYRYIPEDLNETNNLPASNTFKFMFFYLPVGASLIKNSNGWTSNQSSIQYAAFDFAASLGSSPESHGLELFSSSGVKIWDTRFPSLVIKEQVYVSNPLSLPTFTVPSNADWYDVNGTSFRFVDGLYPQCFVQEFGIIRNSTTQISMSGQTQFYPPACSIGTTSPQPFSFIYATTPTI